jgi:hypothetical protein
MAISASKDFIVFPNDNAGKISVNESVFTANGTWTAPASITSAQVILVGGGAGGGGGSQNVAGGGGAGGQVIVKNISVVPGTTYAINIGAGGQGGQGALIAATDITSTMPGANGGTTSFGALTLANLLPNAYFDYAPAQWDANYVWRQISGISGQNILTVFPNTNGIEIGMSILTTAGAAITGMPASPANIVVNINHLNNTISIGNPAVSGSLGALTATISQQLAAFDYDDARVTSANVLYQNISGGSLTSNTQLVGTGASTQQVNLSNNLLAPSLAQFEETNTAGSGTVAGTLVRAYGTSAPTLYITGTSMPAKLREQWAPFTRFISTTSGSSIVTVDSTANLAVGMLLNLPVGVSGVVAGTEIVSIDSSTQVTVQVPSTGTSGTYLAGLTATLSNQIAYFSYSGSSGNAALQLQMPASGTTASAPITISMSSLNNTTTTTGTTTSAGTAGVPWQPGAQYVYSFYISSNQDISTGDIKVQLRSANNSYMAQNNQSYVGGSASVGGNTIDAGIANGYFVREASVVGVAGVGGDVAAGTFLVRDTYTSASAYTTFRLVETPSANPQFDISAAILRGMQLTSTAFTGTPTISNVSTAVEVINGFSMTVMTVTVPSVTMTSTLTALSNSLGIQRPTGTAIIGSGTSQSGVNNSWRRVYAVFNSMPAMQPLVSSGSPATIVGQTATASNLYAIGAQAQFVFPVINIGKPGPLIWIDNAQLELVTAANGAQPTAWMPPLVQGEASALVKVGTATLGNLETSHRFVRASAGVNYYGSGFIVTTGTAQTYRPFYAFLEFFDANYNSLGRTDGTKVYTPLPGIASNNQLVNAGQYTAAYPVRVGLTALSPAGTAFAKLGFSQLQGAQSASAGAIEYHVIAPQLEVGTSATTSKVPNQSGYAWAGQPGNSALVSYAGTYVVAEGGGGGGTFNSNNPIWQYGIEGGNNGGHAAYGSNTYPTLAGGGGGAGGIGVNAVQYVAGTTGSTTFNWVAGWGTTAGLSHQTFPMRGNLGGYAIINSGATAALAPGYAGDGAPGVWPFGLNGNHIGIALGGGGGGAGWINAGATTPNSHLIVPGRGNGGGGKGGGTSLFQVLTPGNQTTATTNTNADYYARGIDGLANTGAGGGGGGSNLANNPNTLLTHYLAGRAVGSEAVAIDATKWTPIYNAAIQVATIAGFYSSTVLRTTIQDIGNAKVGTTAGTNFSVLPRTPLVFTGIAARLTSPSTTTVQSPAFSATNKRVRPTLRWRDINNNVIREDRPPYDIIFTVYNTVTYLGPNTPSAAATGTWETLPSPANAAYFDIYWEFLYMDGQDVVDVDIADIQYFAYLGTGGNGADGLAMIRWFDKTTA